MPKLNKLFSYLWLILVIKRCLFLAALDSTDGLLGRQVEYTNDCTIDPYDELTKNDTTEIEDGAAPGLAYDNDYGECEDQTDTLRIGYYESRKQRQPQNQHQHQNSAASSGSDCVEEFGWPCKHMKTCGQSPMNRLNSEGYLITGGEVSTPGQWPFYAALYRDNTFLCGGAIVSEHHIITAKHCIDDLLTQKDIVSVTALVGTNVHLFRSDETLGRLDNERFAEFHRVERIVQHPVQDQDLAWLFFKKPFRWSYYVQPICFAYDHLTKIDVNLKNMCYVVGAGADHNQASDHPDFVKYVQITKTEFCDTPTGPIANRICYFFRKQNDLTGPGDSGSPVACLDKSTKRWQLKAIHHGHEPYFRLGAAFMPTTAFAKLTSDWPAVSQTCKKSPHGSSICKAQSQCNLPPQIRTRPNQPYLVRIDKTAHDSMRDGGAPCPGVVVSHDLVLTDRNCTLVRYHKWNVLDIAPLDSLLISLDIYETKPGAINGEIVNPNANHQSRVDEIYVLRKFNRDLIMLRSQQNLYENNAQMINIDKHPICWPFNRDIINWDHCKLVRLAQPKHSIEYQVKKVPCPEGSMKHVPDDILSCWKLANLLHNSATPQDIWIAGSPIVCADSYGRDTLVAIIKEFHDSWAMGASVRPDDLDISYWWREIIRHRYPKALDKF